VYVNLVPRMTDPDGRPSNGVLEPNVAHKVEVGPVGEGSTSVEPDVVNEDEVPQPELDAGGMDDEGGGSEDEEAADNDDPTPAIEYFRASGLVDSVLVDYTTYLHGDTRTMTSKLGNGSGARRRLSILSATLLSSQEGSTSVPGQSLQSTRSGAHVIRIALFLCELISQNTKTIL